MNNDNGKVLYSLREAAERLSIGKGKLRTLARQQKITHRRIGAEPNSRYKFTQQNLEDYVHSVEPVEAI